MHWQIRGDNGSADLQKACWRAMNKQAHMHYSRKVRTITLTDQTGHITDTAVVTLQSSSAEIITRVICPVGYQFPVEAVAKSGSTFNGWSDGVGTSQRTITAQDGLTLTAYFGSQSPAALNEINHTMLPAVKIFRNGRIYLLRDNVLYDMLGNVVE